MRKVLYFILILYVVSVSFYLIVEFMDDNKDVAIINEQNVISKKEVVNRLVENYSNDVVSTLVQEEILKMEVEKQNLKEPTREELLKEASNLQLMEGKQVSLESEADLKKVKERIYVKKLAKKFLVDDDELLEFLNENTINLKHKIDISIYSGEHDQLKKIEQDIKNGEELHDVEKKYNISFTKDTISDDNKYNIDPHDININEVYHIHMENSHAILYVENIEEYSEKIELNDTTRKDIIESYLNKEYYSIKIDLFNYLQPDYSVEVADEI